MSNKTITTATMEDGKLALVPKLRFPEFREATGWKGVPLSELVSALDAGVSVNSGDRPATGNEIGVLKTSAVTNGIFEPQENKVVFDEVERGRVKEPVQGGTIIISRMNTPALVGANAYVETSLENIYLPDRLWAAKPKPSTSMRFVAFILGSDKGRAALSKLAKGSSGSMKNITKPDVFAFLIMAPLPAEQQKIAECLSSLDELVAAQARKLDALKTHKKGLMQQLFPREGETQPLLRFPEFQNAGEWEIKPFAKLFSIGNGRDHKHLVSGDIPVYGSGGFMRSVNEYLYDGESVCIGRKGTINNPMFLTGKFWTVDTLFYTHSFNKCLPKFIFSIFQNINWLKHNEAGGVPSLAKTNIEKIEAAIPSIPEQQRIADFLSSLDDLIAAETQKLEAFKAHKKGLMQQLFPTPEKVEV